ncbi:hypothetical protein NL676_022552 [Syzygium grande]|nr:hypothetical protein NL676_022552 [Syzygium grande]
MPLRAHAPQSSPRDSVYFMSRALDDLIKSGDVGSALDVFDEMPAHGLSPRGHRFRYVAVGSTTSPSAPPHGRRLRLVAVASVSCLFAPPCGRGLCSLPSAPPRHLGHMAVGSAIVDMLFNKSQLFQR